MSTTEVNESKWNREYVTSFLNEVMFLKKKGIRYEFVKTNSYQISVWSYKKTPQLFEALAEFYAHPERW